ncbi:unnamed protein product [Effrenium voratum]|nr:unnamed protein product [Effrenium voratum]
MAMDAMTEMEIQFCPTRGSNEIRLLQSKAGRGRRFLGAVAAFTALRRRVGQRLRRKLGRLLMQEEFEQVMAIYKVHEDSLAQEEEDVSTSSCDDTKSTLEPSSPPAVSPVTSMCMVPVPVFSIPVFYPAAAQVTSVGVLYNGSTANGIVPRTATQLQICCDGEGLGVGSKHGGPRKDTATHGLHPDLLVEGI